MLYVEWGYWSSFGGVRTCYMLSGGIGVALVE